jgi:hypothetical protein
LASMLLIPSAYILGRLTIGRAAAISMALICAFGALPIVLSAAIRSYAMMMLAIVWLAIFAFQYQNTQRRKYLIYYFLCCFAAIELHHAAIFAIFPFGILLLRHSFLQKNIKAFLVIFVAHVFLAAAVALYGHILTYYYLFIGNNSYFTGRENFDLSFFNYAQDIIKILIFFIFCEDNGSAYLEFRLLAGAIFLITIINLFYNKRFVLLYLITLPIIGVSFADYTKHYPFSRVTRNNLFLVTSLLLSYGYFAQLSVNYFLELLKKKELKREFLKNRFHFHFTQYF